MLWGRGDQKQKRHCVATLRNYLVKGALPWFNNILTNAAQPSSLKTEVRKGRAKWKYFQKL